MFSLAPPQGIQATGILASTIATAQTWSALQTFTLGIQVGDTSIIAEGGDNVVNVRNGTNAQDFRVWNTYTSDSDGEYGELFWSGNTFNIRTQAVGGGSNRNMALNAPGGNIQFAAGGVTLFNMGSSTFYPNADNSFDLGTTAQAWRSIYFETSILAQGNAKFAHGTSALATTATGGFFHLQSCAGTPTGVPGTIPTGQIPFVFDTTNDRLYFYYDDGGGAAWHYIARTA